jgi:hypothetical protein
MRAAHGWLPLVVPADARRFRVHDQPLAAALADAGAELVDERPDVEIAHSVDRLGGDARLAIVAITGPESRAGHRLVRGARRALHAARARLRAGLERRGLARKGYSEIAVLYWDLPDRVLLPGITVDGPQLPRYALVVGSRGDRGQSAFEAAVAGQRVSWASTRAGLVVAAVGDSLLRVAIGPTRSEIDNGRAALEALEKAKPPAEVSKRIPWPEGRGRVGLADWSLERLLDGAKPPRELSAALREDCLAFLVELGRVRSDASRSHGELASTVGEVCRPEGAERLSSLAARLDQRLADIPRCFAHGDFFAGNLLETNGRLTGVVDWDAAGPGRLPLLDLLHLELTRSGPFADADWARIVLERLLPTARRGGDETWQRYCAKVGVDADAHVLEALVYAYWLDYAAYQLRTHPVRRLQPAWIEGNVELVLRSAPEALAD